MRSSPLETSLPIDLQGPHLAASLHGAAIEGGTLAVLITFFAAMFAIAAYLDRRKEKELEGAWTAAGFRHGLAKLGRFHLEGKVGELTVSAHLFQTGSGNRTQLWSRVTVTGAITHAVTLRSEAGFSIVLGEEIVLGDEAFDRAVKVRGDEAVAVALLDQDTRMTFQGAVGDGWTLENGCWSFKSKGMLGEAVDGLIESGLNLAEMTLAAQSELPRRLRALVSQHSNPRVRRRALEVLLLQHPDLSETKNALDAGLRDTEAMVRQLAADRLGDLGVLDAIVASPLNEPKLRVEALESMVRNRADDPRTRLRVTEWLAAEVPQTFRKAALEAAARVAVPERESHLVAALDDPDDEVKLVAMKTLAAVGTVDAVPALIPFREKLLAFALKGAASDAILAIQARVAGGDAGALSIALEGGVLAVVEERSERGS